MGEDVSDQPAAEAVCKNCGARVSGAYCSDCGQRHLPRGLHLPEIVSELLDSVVRLDSRLWQTFIGLTLNPGKVVSDYVGGKRARFVNPVRYCIAGIAVSAAATIATGEFEQISASLLPQEGTTDTVIRQFTDIFAKYLNLLAIISVPIYTLFLRLLYLRAGKNTAEIFSFSCFVVGHVSVLGVLSTLANSYLFFLGLWPSVAINFFVTTYAAYTFFGRGLLYTLFAVNFSYLAYIAILNAMFWFVFMLETAT